MTDSMLDSDRENRYEIPSNGKWIVVPASVTVLAESSFLGHKEVRSLEFEAGSHLREIERTALSGCHELQNLCIPASVEKLEGGSLPMSRTCRIELASGNPSFARQGDFLIDLNHHSILRYFGSGAEVEIPGDIETIADGCFCDCRTLCSVEWGPSPRLTSIGALAFQDCSRLNMITIPSSVTFLGRFCFCECRFLDTVVFCSGSRMNCIGESAFATCTWLRSIVLPSTVKTLQTGCRVFRLSSTCEFAIANRFGDGSN
jgi:hypothetical protein